MRFCRVFLVECNNPWKFAKASFVLRWSWNKSIHVQFTSIALKRCWCKLRCQQNYWNNFEPHRLRITTRLANLKRLLKIFISSLEWNANITGPCFCLSTPVRFFPGDKLKSYANMTAPVTSGPQTRKLPKGAFDNFWLTQLLWTFWHAKFNELLLMNEERRESTKVNFFNAWSL